MAHGQVNGAQQKSAKRQYVNYGLQTVQAAVWMCSLCQIPCVDELCSITVCKVPPDRLQLWVVQAGVWAPPVCYRL